MDDATVRRPTLHEAAGRLLTFFYEAKVTSPYRGLIELQETQEKAGLTPAENMNATLYLAHANLINRAAGRSYEITPYGVEVVDGQRIPVATLPPPVTIVVYSQTQVINLTQQAPDPEVKKMLQQILDSMKANQAPPADSWPKIAAKLGRDVAVNLFASWLAAQTGIGK